MPRLLTLACAVAMGLALGAHSGRAQGSPAGRGTEARQVEALQDRMRSRPEVMDAISALQADPEFQAALADPEVAAAIQSGNMAALLANPKVARLLDHPTVQEITKKLGEPAPGDVRGAGYSPDTRQEGSQSETRNSKLKTGNNPY